MDEIEDVTKRFTGQTKQPIENKNWIPSFDILSWQAGTCGYKLIPNIKPLENNPDENGDCPF